MLNTFFFGYLSLKWRRLVRTLILFFLVLVIIGIIDKLPGYFEWGITADLILLLNTALIIIVSTIIISYVLKPFVVKEE
jgi:hypothetical protein